MPATPWMTMKTAARAGPSARNVSGSLPAIGLIIARHSRPKTKKPTSTAMTLRIGFMVRGVATSLGYCGASAGHPTQRSGTLVDGEHHRQERPRHREHRRREAAHRDDEVIDALGLERVQELRGEVAPGESAEMRPVVDAVEQQAHHQQHHDAVVR